MSRSLNKSTKLIIPMLLLAACANTKADPARWSCAFQWTTTGYFGKDDVVRYRGNAYVAKQDTKGNQPDISAVWQKLGACPHQLKASCDFNGDGKLDTAKAFPYVSMVGGKIHPDVDSLEDRENANAYFTGEVSVTYNDNSADKTADVIWDQNRLGMLPYARTDARFGETLAVGDFNNDTFCDLAIGAPGFGKPGFSKTSLEDEDHNKGLVNILYGSPNGLTITVLGTNGRPINPYDAQRFDQDSPNVQGTMEKSDGFGRALAAGDFNNDGYDDVAIGVPGEAIGKIDSAGYFHVLYGSRVGIQTISPKPFAHVQDINVDGVLTSDAQKYDDYGSTAVAADFDKDGYSDLVVAAPGEGDQEGRISVFRGTTTGLNPIFKRDISEGDLRGGQSASRNRFGTIMHVEDFNSDGYPDLIVSVNIPFWNSKLTQYVIPGSNSGLRPEYTVIKL